MLEFWGKVKERYIIAHRGPGGKIPYLDKQSHRTSAATASSRYSLKARHRFAHSVSLLLLFADAGPAKCTPKLLYRVTKND